MIDRYFVAGVIIGLIIGAIWRNLQPKPTPPGRNDKILSPDFTEQKVAV